MALSSPVATLSGLGLRAARLEDGERVWQLDNVPTVRAASRALRPIPLDEHRRWFAERLADPDTLLALVELGGEPVGVVRVERAGARAEITIAIDAASRGRGVGAAAVRAAVAVALDRWPETVIEAWIAADNRVSQRCFLAAGFVLRGLEGSEDHVFLRYTFDGGARPG